MAFLVVSLGLLCGLGLSWSWDNAVSIYQPNEIGDLIDVSPTHYIGTIGNVSIATYDQPYVANKSKGGYAAGVYLYNATTLFNASDPAISYTFAVWLNYNATTTDYERILEMSDGTDSYLATMYRNLATIDFYIHETNDCYTTLTIAPAVGDWVLAVATWDGSNNTCGIYVNNATNKNTAVGASTKTNTAYTHVRIGQHFDATQSLVHFNTNQIVFWNKALSVAEIADFFNSGTGQLYAPAVVPDYLNLTYLSPDMLNVTDNNSVLFQVAPTAKSDYLNCSLDINGTIYANETAIVNNSAVNWTITLANSTYGFNMSCYTSTLYNSTDNYVLNVLVPNITQPAPNYTSTQYDVWGTPTLQLCLSNTTLFVQYNETIIDDTGAHIISRSKNIICTNGCDKNKNACNGPFYESLGQLFLAFIAVVIIIAVIYYFVL
jgi:hypothetical protein